MKQYIENLHESQTGPSGALPGLCEHAVTYAITGRTPGDPGTIGWAESAIFTAINHDGGPNRTLKVTGYDQIVALIETFDEHQVLVADRRYYEENGFERGKYKSEEELQELIDANHQSFPVEIQP